MNPIAEEILMHYGMPRRSGRYPWGSGENPYQHSGDFLSRIDELKSQGMSDTEIAKAMGLTTTQYRTQKSLAKDERRALDVARAKSLREDGLSLNEIAKEMGFANDSSVRSLLNENSEVRMNQAKTTAEFIKKQIDEKGMIDVGAGVERELGISKEKLNEALYMLEMTLTQNVKSEVYNYLTNSNINEVNRYIALPMTATQFFEEKKSPGSKEQITAELVYYWMIVLNIPFECQKWHLNKLFTLIRVCDIKSRPPKKHSRREIMKRNAALNAARKKKWNTKG
ncbi:hypothetical protein GMD00_03660 [[Ruminococcus] torques]|uniref:hypothetical protein n=1 Tax=[Ruminococcus] torques TaxID=33039 RepID=UPI0012BB4B9B|nr:hypothetical protein [[Ruminococcus] torques]MTQ77131.1 hypothetical protein [[Ruminococcus] torques]